jgi:sulfide:quinone oxidoreductase
MIKLGAPVDITLIEPSDTHWYQPAWTLVGAGTFDYKKTKKPMADLIPKGVKWVKDKAIGFMPEKNKVSTEKNGDIEYDFLVISAGLVNEFSLIPGLEESIDKGNVCSVYTDPNHVWEVLKNFKGGRAIFTQPNTPIKCGGAPQKIAYLAADYFRKNNLSDKTKVTFATPGSVIFGVKPIAETLHKVIERYHMDFKPSHTLVRINADKNEATFKHTGIEGSPCFLNEDGVRTADGDGSEFIVKYDMLHLAPPQAAPKFIRESVLANEQGWLDVNINTLQHKKYPNIFGIGDVAALPTAKTGAAIRKQSPVVIDNILSLIKSGKLGSKEYTGYSSCPLVTGYGKMVLAEFNYKNEFTPDPKLKLMFIFESSKEHWRLWMLKKYGLPYLYWNKMMKGEEV